jgi:hypothetical protein
LKGNKMPAYNMGGALITVPNPSSGKAVLMSSFSGPKGSVLDAKVAVFYDNLPGGEAWTAPVEDPDNISTGALSTGIGFGLNDFDGFFDGQPGRVLPDQNFNDDYIPGVTKVGPTVLVSATTSELVAIGGGKSLAAVVGVSVPGVSVKDGIAVAAPYTAGFGLLGWGGGGVGGARDAGAGPIYTGFETKMVTATAPVAVGAAVETGWTNRTSFALVSGKSVFGSATAASAVPA